MSDEQRKHEETEVEAHGHKLDANAEPPREEIEDDVEAHVRRSANLRMD
jgi:hypothetical protein